MPAGELWEGYGVSDAGGFDRQTSSHRGPGEVLTQAFEPRDGGGQRPREVIELRVEPLQVLQRPKDAGKRPVEPVPVEEDRPEHGIVGQGVGKRPLQIVPAQQQRGELGPLAEARGEGPGEAVVHPRHEAVVLDLEVAHLGELPQLVGQVSAQVVEACWPPGAVRREGTGRGAR